MEFIFVPNFIKKKWEHCFECTVYKMLCRHFFAFLLGFMLHIAVLEHGFLISMKGPENVGLY